MRKAKSSPEKIAAAKKEYVGAKMANLLHFMSSRLTVPEEMRKDCAKLQAQWDSVSNLRLNNPIVIAELDKELGFSK